MDQHLEVIGAFIDGERVDADALRAALAIDEGRAYLVELAAMREIVAMPAIATLTPAQRSSAWSARLLVAAAGVVVAAGISGYAIGEAHRSAQATVTTLRAPEPTRVMKLQTGVDWNESRSFSGGH